MSGTKPKATFTRTQAKSPKQSIFRELTRSPTNPLTNLEMP